MTSTKCIYCKADHTTDFCSYECREKTYEFAAFANKYFKLFILGIILPHFLMIPGFIFLDYISFFLGAMFFIWGVLIIFLPFTTPDTVRWLGLKKAITVGRWCGVFMIAMGLYFAFILF